MALDLISINIKIFSEVHRRLGLSNYILAEIDCAAHVLSREIHILNVTTVIGDEF